MFRASTSTFESPLSTYVHFMFSSFHSNTSKIAVFSHVKKRGPNPAFKGGVNTFVNKNGFWCRMNVIQSALYFPDLGEHFKYLLYDYSTHRKFFIVHWSSKTPSKSHFSSNFITFSPFKSNFQRSSKYKNRWVLSFASIKKDWCVVWIPRALC